MAAVRRVVRLGGGWLAAALAATAVSWAAIRGIVDDPLPGASIGGSIGTSDVGPSPVAGPPLTAGPTTRPEQHRTTTTAARSTTTPRARAATTTSRTSTTTTTTPAGQLRKVDTQGGRVVVELLADDARLVSVVPAPGFESQTWSADGWLRVDLVSPTDRSSVIVTWNGQPPQVQTIEY